MKVFRPEIRLKKLLKMPGGISVDTALDRAEEGVESLRESGVAAIDEKIGRIAQCARTGAETEEAYRLANEIFNEAGVFGLVELSQAASSLCKLLSSEEGARNGAAFRVHADTLLALRNPGICGNAANRRAVLAGLHRITERFAEEASAQSA
ncbi:hypothetical protein [Terricaulis sp.]|uniref:hypothetical protein n=1 Tax=Terricaulis sp. TaxID=2768686 RepID=UPI003782D3CB